MVFVAMTGADSVSAQSRQLPDAPGTWKPWKPFSASNAARQDQAVTPALVKAFEAELLALNAILQRASGVSSPVGFSVETWGHLSGYHLSENAPGQPAGSTLPIGGGLTFGAFPVFEYVRNGKTIREDTGETALQSFVVNQIGRSVIDNLHVDEWGGIDTDAFLKPMPQGEIAGLPRYGDALVIARDPAALWTPLTERAALDLVAAARRATAQQFEDTASANTARLAVVRDPAYRTKRLSEAKEAAASMPNAQAFLKQIEEALRIEEETLAKDLSPTGSTGKQLLDAKRSISEVTDWIAELTPAQASAPACYAAKGATLRAKFPLTPSADCQPLVRPNYAYFNKTLPRSTPQVLLITGMTRCFNTADKYNRDANSTSPAGCRANRALVETVDKNALRAWVK
ncbi:MAG TPA: hypothetical protein VK955_17345 [Xanthobacteraceae bacterium]|nr:hypothetical protein [Xanthobacteraceae bacterium]